jgi:LacI family transcriptional regulator
VLLCSNGYALATVAQDLVALGLEVPGDIDLACMDDAGPFDVLPLTAAAVSLPARDMGRRAMTLLHERVSGTPSETQLIVLPVTIQTRQSSVGYMRISRLEQGAS